MGVFPKIRAKYERIQMWQMQQFGRLVDLLENNVSMVFSTIKKCLVAYLNLENFLSVTFDLQQLIQEGRLLIITIPKPHYFHVSVSLATILLCDYERIKDLEIGRETKIHIYCHHALGHCK